MVVLCGPCEGSPSAVHVVIGLDGGVSPVDPAGSSVPEATGSTRSQRWGHCSGRVPWGCCIADPTILEDRAVVGTTTVSRAFLLEEVVTAVLHSLGWDLRPVGWPIRILALTCSHGPFTLPPFWRCPLACSTVAKPATMAVVAPLPWQFRVGEVWSHLFLCVLFVVPPTHRPPSSRKRVSCRSCIMASLRPMPP